MSDQIEQAVAIVRRGGIIAYPTEAVFGLGCDPQNHKALQRLIKIKGRDAEKGFILIASRVEQISPYLMELDHEIRDRVLASWPGPVTWIWPASDSASALLRGKHHGIAVRVSAHPTVVKLCNALDAALISTSANRSGGEPCRTAQQVRQLFNDEIDYVVDEPVGEASRPSEIRDALTGKILRAG